MADELFSVQSFITLQGGAAAAVVVPSVINGYFVRLPKPALSSIGFVIAQFASYLGAYLSADTSNLKWFIAALNGFVIFSAAAGINQGLFSLASPGNGEEPPLRGTDRGPQRRFLKSWF